MDKDKFLREQLVNLIKGDHAYMPFDHAVADFPEESINQKPTNVPYTFWHLIEHLRITQHDILDFSINKNYKYMKWPDAYWPDKNAKATKKDWNKTIKDFNLDLAKMIKLVKNPKTDLYAKFSWGEGQTVIREAMVLANHNAYHIGELAILRQTVKNWPKSHE